jgi:Ca-activated chloride channel family protein
VPVEVGSLSMTGRLSHPFIAPGTSDVFATLDIEGVKVPGAARAPVNLAVVIDRSGSMAGAKIAAARAAALKLVDLLDEHDRLAIVQYGTDVRVVSASFATPENKERMRRSIAGIVNEGGTNTGDALVAGRAQLETARSDFRVNRLILLSDGQPTVGITSAQGLANVVSGIRRSGITVTSLGVGSDFNEDLMQRLADVGGGSYGFISERNASDTTALFERDLKQAGTMVAREVSLTVTLPEGVRFVEAYGRPVAAVDATGSHLTLTLPDFSAEQTEKVVLHLTASPGARTGTIDMGGYQLSYQDLLSAHPAQTRVALAAAMTTDVTVAQARRDKTALVVATKAQAAANYKLAADAMDRGDFHQAQAAIAKNTVLFDDAEQVAGHGAIADERASNDSMFGLSTRAPSAPAAARSEAVKEMKRQSLKSSGRGESAY